LIDAPHRASHSLDVGFTQTPIGLLRRRRLLMLAIVAAFVGIADLIALLTPATYEATALMVIDQRATSPSSDLNAALTTGQLLAAHYIKLATTKTVLDQVCSDAADGCSFDSLKGHVAATTVKGTDLLAVSVTDGNASRAANLANLVATKLMAEQQRETANALKATKSYLDGELTRLSKELGSAKPQYTTALQAQYTTAYNRREAVAEQESRLQGGLSLVQNAAFPDKPAFSRAKLYVGAGLVAGLVAALIVALIVDRIDSRIYAKEALSEATAAPLVVAC